MAKVWGGGGQRGSCPPPPPNFGWCYSQSIKQHLVSCQGCLLTRLLSPQLNLLPSSLKLLAMQIIQWSRKVQLWGYVSDEGLHKLTQSYVIRNYIIKALAWRGLDVQRWSYKALHELELFCWSSMSHRLAKTCMFIRGHKQHFQLTSCILACQPAYTSINSANTLGKSGWSNPPIQPSDKHSYQIEITPYSTTITAQAN